MKKISVILVMMITLLMGNVITASATEIKTEQVKVTNIEIRANVPDGFNKQIEINFNLKDGTNALYTLDKQDGYVYKGVIPIGQANLNFINIIPDDETFDISSPGTINAEQGKTVNYSVSLKKSSVQKNKKEMQDVRKNYDNTNYEKQNKDNDLNYKNDLSSNPNSDFNNQDKNNVKANENSNDSNKQESNQDKANNEEIKDKQNKQEVKQEVKQESTFWTFIKNHIVTIVIVTFLAIAYVYYKFFR